MEILVVCGAGASSTFVAQRIRRGAEAEGLDLRASAGTEAMLPGAVDAVDVVLLGPQLTARAPEIRRCAALVGAAVAVLPESVFRDPDGTAALELARRELAAVRAGADTADIADADHSAQEDPRDHPHP
ncbi:PTS sugar transporter subunit IIB [Nesterenkonia sp. F]|uniref:PTS sugar transporter subunit IIB n=1 Tax=Nesterenkonia sp. F TaxID=795955 RepID=UPI000255D528|nr:phosphotransferase system cellobiose-specific component IIB [Nesterenkonia sp. F]